MSASSSSTKKIKQMSVDRLSALPDAILCYILSFLEMKEAAITCLLSKRWQFLWTQLPALRFDDRMAWGMEKTRKFVSRVHKTLVICSRYNLERLEVDFVSSYEQCFASDGNVWIGFAVENKVEIFKLLLSGTMGDSHWLPQMMYSNPSWTSLSLQGCFMYPRGTIQWPSLTTLFIEDVDLSEHTFEKVFSGCPVLSSLDLVICRGFSRLEVSSTSLLRLAIQDEDRGCWGELEISAPHLHSLKIEWHSKYERLCVENIESLVRAEIEIDDEWEGCHPKIGRNSIKQLFVSTRHVKMLKLGPRCLQFLSLITSKWQLPQSTRRCLELHAYRGNRGIHGIVTLLKSSPSLETLVIRVDEHYGQDHYIPNTALKKDLDCDFFHLKYVRFKIFGDPNPDTGERLLALIRTLLKRAIILEKMVVDLVECTSSSAQTASYKMAKILLSYPRSSQKAVVLFC